MSDESQVTLESILSTASELEAEGLRDAAVKLLSDFLSDPTNTNDLSQTDLIRASTKLSRLKQERDRAKTLREEALHSEKAVDFFTAEQKWRELLAILPNDQEVKDRLESLPERRKHSESIRLKLTLQDALEREQGVLAAKCLEEYRTLFPADLWAIEMLPKVQAAKEKEERSDLQRQLKDSLSRNRHRMAIQVGEAMEKRGWLESHDLELYRHAHSKIAELTTLKQRGAELYALGDLKSALRCYDEAQMIETDDPTLSEESSRIRKIISLMDSLRIALSDRNKGRVEKIVHELALLRHDSEDVQEIIREHRKRGKKRRLVLAYAAAVIAVIAGGIYLSDTDRKPAQSSTARSSQAELPFHQPPARLSAASPSSWSDRSEVPKELRWETKAPMPTPRVGAMTAVIGNQIHVIGGKASNNAIVGTNELYDPQTDTWRTKATMPTPRSSPGIAVHKGLIYVFGGVLDSGELTAAVEVYDPATDSWNIAAPMQTTLRHFTAVEQIGSKVYVVGGVTASGNAPVQKGVGLLEVFDLSANTWHKKADMPTPRRTPGIGLVDGKLFVVGGAATTLLSTTERYDPMTDRWSHLPPMPTPRNRLRVASLQHLVFAIGGSLEVGRTSMVEIYDTSSRTWKVGPPMPTARESIAVAVVGNAIFVIGGRHDQDGIIATNEMLDCRPLFANAQNNDQESDANQATTVFNGVDLSAFDTQGESNVWSVQDGMILGNNPGLKDGYLFSKEAYRDFTMTVDFKVMGNTNSGVFFHSRMENGTIRGIQAEIQPPFEGKSGGTGCLYETGGRGWLINPDTLTQTQQKAFRINDWNTLQVEVRDHHIQTKLNGVQIVDFTNHNPKWDSGLIALQMAGNKDGSILWRNLEVRPIPRGAAPARMGNTSSKIIPSGSNPPPNPKAGDEWHLEIAPEMIIEMVYVPGGTFMMGTPDEDAPALKEWVSQNWIDEDSTFSVGFVDSEMPRHEVTLSPFWIGKKEVTNAQFRVFKPEHDSGLWGDEPLNRPEQPVVKVSWSDAKEFTQWLSSRFVEGFRLPTEAEWEFACNGGKDGRFHWGNDSNEAIHFTNLRDISAQSKFGFPSTVTWDDGFAVSAPVGRLKPNSFGIHDMLGNVWEWCEDFYQEDFYSEPTASGLNPVCRKSGSRGHIRRGGSWWGEIAYVRSAARWFLVNETGGDVGIRVLHSEVSID